MIYRTITLVGGCQAILVPQSRCHELVTRLPGLAMNSLLIRRTSKSPLASRILWSYARCPRLKKMSVYSQRTYLPSNYQRFGGCPDAPDRLSIFRATPFHDFYQPQLVMSPPLRAFSASVSHNPHGILLSSWLSPGIDPRPIHLRAPNSSNTSTCHEAFAAW